MSISDARNRRLVGHETVLFKKKGDHFDRFVTNHRPKTATPGVAGSLTDIMEMHLHVWRVSRVQNAHVWRGTAPPFTIHSHMPPKPLHWGKSDS
jgi:hypothetical protein